MLEFLQTVRITEERLTAFSSQDEHLPMVTRVQYAVDLFKKLLDRMMTLAACLSSLTFFMELVEYLVGVAFPDTFQNSVYRLTFFIYTFLFYLIFCFSNNSPTIYSLSPLSLSSL